jgi:hypothetical protein
VCCCPLQALRSAFDRFSSSGSFEVVLRQADAAPDAGSSSSSSKQAWGSVKSGKQAAAPAAGSDGGSGTAAAAERLHTVLLRCPAVFTLAVVWESPKVSREGACQGMLKTSDKHKRNYAWVMIHPARYETPWLDRGLDHVRAAAAAAVVSCRHHWTPSRAQ